jgi:hypothetical protein
MRGPFVFVLLQYVRKVPARYRTANEGPVRVQYKCLFPIYAFPEMKLCTVQCAASLVLKQNYNVLSPNFHIHVSVSELYISRISLPILLQPNRQTDPGNIYVNPSQIHEL